MEEKSKNKWLVPVGIGCAVLLCLCLVGVGAVYFLGDRVAGQLPFDLGQFSDGDLLPEPGEDAQPGGQLNVTEEAFPADSAADESEDTTPPLPGTTYTGGQYVSDTEMFDDFSSDSLGWLEFDDGSTILKYENQMYSFEITETDYLDWTYVPAPFYPSTIQFDVQARPGEVDGSVGVNCLYLDESNHYYVEIDLGFQDAIFAMVKDDEFVPLTEQNDDGQYWQKLSYLNSPPESVNTIMVTCTPETITLYVNGQFEYEIQVSDPLAGPGDMALFLYTYETAASGYKVYFDNVLVEE